MIEFQEYIESHFFYYFLGGIRNNKASSEVHVYLTYTNKWQSLPKMNTARYHHACVTQDNMLYAVGGYIQSSRYQDLRLSDHNPEHLQHLRL